MRLAASSDPSMQTHTHMHACAHAHPCIQAQERGELVQLQDDAVYALDGLAPGSSLATQRDAATTLAEILALRRGRAALRCV